MTDLLQQAADYFRKHEGTVDHMYLDVVGLVTVGVGCLLPSAKAAAQLPFKWRTTGAAATARDIEEEWLEIKGMRPAMRADYYRPVAILYLEPEVIEAEMMARLATFLKGLRARWPALDSFVRPAQIGLLDMAYSLGVAGLVKKYPRFCAAVDRGDWLAASEECERLNVSGARNKALRELFKKGGFIHVV